MLKGYLLPFSKDSGEHQMRLDNLMLKCTQKDGQPRLRLYDWSEPTISLGRFQERLQLSKELPQSHFPQVHRCTGGRAVLHENDITYAIAIPLHITTDKSIAAIYELITRPIMEALSKLYHEEFTLAVNRKAPAPSILKKSSCFQAPSFKEILLKGSKIHGAAMIKKRGTALQHGTLLYNPTKSWQRGFQDETCPGLYQINPTIERESVIATLTTALMNSFKQVHWIHERSFYKLTKD